ncbi:MAG: hypothetical protein AAFY34_08000 [Pseudomonadota bacterium]
MLQEHSDAVEDAAVDHRQALTNACATAPDTKPGNGTLGCSYTYSQTADAMMRACIESGTHYTDITGEIDVFLHGQSLSEAAKASGIVLMPGVGLDIIPTDSVASKLAEALPDADHLVLGIDGDTEFSPGTAKTAVSVISDGMKVMRGGKLKSVSRSFEMREIDFGDGKKSAGVVPWGDLGTAYYSTGIPNVTVYMPARISAVQRILFPIIQQFMRLSFVQNQMKKRIDSKVKGPNATKRASSPTYIWGEATNKKGDKVTCRIQTQNGYEFTGNSIVFTAQHLMKFQGAGGFFTPSQLLGIDAVSEMEGVSEMVLT